jgi:hypothetical protein
VHLPSSTSRVFKKSETTLEISDTAVECLQKPWLVRSAVQHILCGSEVIPRAYPGPSSGFTITSNFGFECDLLCPFSNLYPCTKPALSIVVTNFSNSLETFAYVTSFEWRGSKDAEEFEMEELRFEEEIHSQELKSFSR